MTLPIHTMPYIHVVWGRLQKITLKKIILNFRHLLPLFNNFYLFSPFVKLSKFCKLTPSFSRHCSSISNFASASSRFRNLSLDTQNLSLTSLSSSKTVSAVDEEGKRHDNGRSSPSTPVSRTPHWSSNGKETLASTLAAMILFLVRSSTVRYDRSWADDARLIQLDWVRFIVISTTRSSIGLPLPSCHTWHYVSTWGDWNLSQWRAGDTSYLTHCISRRDPIPFPAFDSKIRSGRSRVDDVRLIQLNGVSFIVESTSRSSMGLPLPSGHAWHYVSTWGDWSFLLHIFVVRCFFVRRCLGMQYFLCGSSAEWDDG